LSRAYGKFPAKHRNQGAPQQATEIQVNITGRHTIEQLALEVQRALAIVQDFGTFGVEKFRFRLLPMSQDAEPMILRDEQGRQVTVINIPDMPAEPAYRLNEPGVGVVPTTLSEAPRDVATSSNIVRPRHHTQGR